MMSLVQAVLPQNAQHFYDLFIQDGDARLEQPSHVHRLKKTTGFFTVWCPVSPLTVRVANSATRKGFYPQEQGISTWTRTQKSRFAFFHFPTQAILLASSVALLRGSVWVQGQTSVARAAEFMLCRKYTHRQQGDRKAEQRPGHNVTPVVLVVWDSWNSDAHSYPEQANLQKGTQQPAEPPRHPRLQINLQ